MAALPHVRNGWKADLRVLDYSVRRSPSFQIVEVIRIADAFWARSANVIPTECNPKATLPDIVIALGHLDRPIVNVHPRVRLGDPPTGSNTSARFLEVKVHDARIDGFFRQAIVSIESRPSVQIAHARLSGDKPFYVINKLRTWARLLRCPSLVLLFHAFLFVPLGPLFGLAAANQSANGEKNEARPHAPTFVVIA
jgi:hypothetical protein